MFCVRFCGLATLFLTWRGHCCFGNKLALSPPMGWITSERFECNTDCTNYPDDCISENLVKSTMDAMMSQGLKDAGYKYVIVGDCWMTKTRDSQGNLSPDPKCFPGGIKQLADYAHSKGFLFGLHIDLGNATQNGYPGSYGNYSHDASTLASWGVDYVKATAYFMDGQELNTAYISMASRLNQTGRPMLFACDWPLELTTKGQQVDYKKIASVCNVFTSNKSMVDSWESLKSSIKFSAKIAKDVTNHSGPGHWYLPNLLLVGDYGLSLNEQKMQMAAWSIMAAPLLVSADLRHLQTEQLALLRNKGTIGIDQDDLYQMGFEVQLIGQVHIWRKPIQPKGSYALLIMYFNVSGGPSRVSIVVRDLGLIGAAAYNLTDVFTGQYIGTYKSWYTFDCEVKPAGSLFVRAEAVP